MRLMQSALLAPVTYPRVSPGGRMQMVTIPAERIPPGWQTVQWTVEMRLATCEETDCPNFLRGWTEVLLPGGEALTKEGQVSADEAAQTVGYYGPHSLPPAVIHHPAGTPCPEVHKVPKGTPPMFRVNGRMVGFTEFEDALGGGLHRAEQIQKEGR